MFPGAHSHVYRNEAGEPIGWDNTYYDEPEYDEEQFLYHPEDDDDLFEYCELCEDEHALNDCPKRRELEDDPEDWEAIKRDEDNALLDYENKGHF